MAVVARHRNDRTLHDFVCNIFCEEIMSSNWYQEALAEGRAEGFAMGRAEGLAIGRAEGRAEARRERLLRVAHRFLSPEVVEQLASITDVDALEEAIFAAPDARRQ